MFMVITKLALWRISSIIAFLGYLIIKVILDSSKLISNRYYQDFHDDELIKETDTVNSRNKLYFSSGEAKNYIPKYIIAKTAYDKYVICNYLKNYKDIKFFVVEYNFKKKVIAVLDVHETYTSDASRIIPIHKKTKYVNIVIKEVEGKVINSRVIMPISLKHIRKYSFYTSLSTFLLIYALRQLCIEFVGALSTILPKTPLINIKLIQPYISDLSDISSIFLTNLVPYNLIIILAGLGLMIFSYVISVLSFRKRNKTKTGKDGVIEYEFL